MNLVVCPHCGTHRIVTSKVPKDVVVVLPCPACRELVILFRNKVVALDRKIIEHGTFEERKDHIAGIIAEFLEPGMFSIGSDPESEGKTDDDESDREAGPEDEEPPFKSDRPITQHEVDNFVHIDLNCIDDPAYFKRHFG